MGPTNKITLSGINRSSTNFRRGLKQVSTAQSKWTLKSGVTVNFTEITIDYDQLKNNTFVDFENNGRNQSLLTPEILKRLSSLDKQQYYPAIGFKHEDGRIEILDGSSRRAYVLNKNGEIPEFRIMLADEPISKSDAKQLAKEIRSALELNLYELGEHAEIYEKENKTQMEIAEILDISQRKVSYALRTRAIPLWVVMLFPNVNNLTWENYLELIKLAPKLPTEQEVELGDVKDLKTKEIIKKLFDLTGEVKSEKNSNKNSEIFDLINFDKSTKQRAEKVVNSKYKYVQYKFKQLGGKANNIIDKKIEEAMKEIERLKEEDDLF